MALIAIDARESGTSTGRYVDKLIEYIHKAEPKLDLNIITKPHRVDFFKKIAPNYFVLETNAKEFTFAEQLELMKQIKSLDADLVHFGMVQQPIFYRRPAVTTIHDLTTTRFINPDKNPVVFRVKRFIYKIVIKAAAKKSILIMTPTKYVKDDVIDFTKQPAKKFVVTYEAADKIKDRAEPYTALKGKPFIMYVGRPTPHKNLERLIEAFKLLKETHPELNLVLVGKKDLNYQQLADRAKAEGLKNVVFTDFITEGQLRWLYENCAAYVFPSLSEGFGLPALEAMMHGAPVASSNYTCLPEVYGDAVSYFNPVDVEDMAKVIRKVVDNNSYRDTLIAKGYYQADRYSWETMAEQTLDVYRQALKSVKR